MDVVDLLVALNTVGPPIPKKLLIKSHRTGHQMTMRIGVVRHAVAAIKNVDTQFELI